MLNFQTLWTTEDAATFLKMSTRQITALRERNTGPDYLKFDRAIRYRPAEVVRWATDHTVTTDNTAAPTGN